MPAIDTIKTDSRKPFTARVWSILSGRYDDATHYGRALETRRWLGHLRTNGSRWYTGSRLLLRNVVVLSVMGDKALVEATVPALRRWDTGNWKKWSEGNRHHCVIDRSELELVG